MRRRNMTEAFDPYHRWLGIPARHQPANHYRLLALELFESDLEVIRDAAERQIAHVRRYELGKHRELSQKILNELGKAKACLLDEQKRTAYDRELRQQLAVESEHAVAAPPAPAEPPRSEDAAERTQPSTSAEQPAADLRPPSTRRGAVSRRRRSSIWNSPIVMGGAVTGFLAFVLGAVFWMSSMSSKHGKGGIAGGNGDPVPAKETRSKPALAVAPFTAEQGKKHQRVWAQHLGVSTEMSNSIGMKLVLIPAGEFDMGSTQEEVNELLEEAQQRGLHGHKWYTARTAAEAPRHGVRVTQAFYLGKYEVTVGQFRQFVDATGYRTDGEKSEKGSRGFDGETMRYGLEFDWRNPGFPQDENHPVGSISWNDAVAFCQWLSGKEGKQYRLPTEAEWEYACRAGTTTRFYSGDAADTLRDLASLCDVSCPFPRPGWGQWAVSWDDGYPFTAPVGRFQANAFGLHDMHGNVCEWCQDWHGEDYYKMSPPVDPHGPESGTERSCRGGCWFNFASSARAAYRSYLPPDSCHDLNGFRVVLPDVPAASPSAVTHVTE